MMPDVGEIEPELKEVGTSAWQAAAKYGFDMSLIEANLRRTPAERIRMHARTLALALALRQQMKNRRAGP
jgi:hypothetical protein